MDDRNNTIAGWVLGAGIAALGSSILFGTFVFHAETPEHGKQGYAIEGVESSDGPAAAAGPPIEVLLASADAAKGAEVFKKCTACHTIAAGGKNGIGPNLHGVLGKPVAGHPGFAFTDALKSKGGNWDWATMSEWLSNPKKFAPGTKMTFAGLGKAEDRANLMVYLNNEGSSLPLPAVPAAAPAEGAAPAADGAAPAADAKAGEMPAAAPSPAPAK